MSARKKKRRPRLRIPPPAPHWRFEHSESFFGHSILCESEDGLGLSLWRAARVVKLRVESVRNPSHATLDRLRVLFSHDPDNGLSMALFDVFARALARGETITNLELGDACTSISQWASETWRKETAIQFGELAARIDSENPARANAAGRICRDAGLMDRAGVWLERGFRLALRHKDRTEAVRALLSYGALMQEIGRLDDARRWFLKAAKRAARTGRKKSAAETRHDLMALAAEAGDFTEVQEHANAAVELYPLHHQRLPYLAHDLAFALVRAGHYELALSLLESFVRVIPPRYMLPGMATFAWAAAGRGLVHRYDEAEGRVLNQISLDEQQAAPSLIFLAEGARLLGRWERAERHAREAIVNARRLQQSRYERDAEALLLAILERARGWPTVESGGDLGGLTTLARHLRARLKRWSPARADHAPSDGDSFAAGSGG